MGSDKLQIRPQHRLYLIDDLGFHSGHVGQEGAALDILLIGFNPLQEYPGIEGEHYYIVTGYVVRINLSRTAVYEALFQRIIYAALRTGDCTHVEAPAFQCLGVTAADQSESYNQYLLVISQHRRGVGIWWHQGSRCYR